MSGIATEATTSTGHACYPPTNAIGPYAPPTVKINGRLVQLKGITMYAPHSCGAKTPVHAGVMRMVVEGAPFVTIGGIAVVRIGDLISCGDVVAVGSKDTFVGNGGGTGVSTQADIVVTGMLDKQWQYIQNATEKV
jgi:uncharacterized Zn-binding protein involved in type VI secretion